MPIKQDFLSYHRSIGEELKLSENRIRHLIGTSHWLTDGEHKESILRKVISEFAPEIFRIGSGFVCFPDVIQEERDNSSQIDVLVTSKASPTLYKSGDLHFVTSDCVHAIVEVKTRVANGKELKKVLQKLSEQVRSIRMNSGNTNLAWAGLFIFSEGGLNDLDVLKVLQKVTRSDPLKIINCIAIGENIFLRYWGVGQPSFNNDKEAKWSSYQLEKLSHAYFVSNLVDHLSPVDKKSNSDAWFPIQGTKEMMRSKYAIFGGKSVFEFS